MKTVLPFVILASLMALMVAHSESEQNEILVRVAKEAGQGRIKNRKTTKTKRFRNKIRRNNMKKKKEKKRMKKLNKTKKNSKTKKAKKARTKINRQNECSKGLAEKLGKKANSWRNAIINIKKPNEILKKKAKSLEADTLKVPKMFQEAAEALGKVTEMGTKCLGECDQSVCNAYNLLSNCTESAKEACTFNFDKETELTTNEEECKAELGKMFLTCQDESNQGKCCTYTPLLNATKPYGDFAQRCYFAEDIQVLRDARTRCLDKDKPGSFGNCMSLLKSSSSMISKCLSTPAPAGEIQDRILDI